MYNLFNKYYDEIFPLSSQKLAFVVEFISEREQVSFLDIGCGTGALCHAVSSISENVVGIDLEESMIKLSQDNQTFNESFFCVDMREVGDYFSECNFKVITCLGNTLPHLDSEAALFKFFADVHSILRPGGVFLVQTLNYDRILAKKIQKLPTVENESFIFERDYLNQSDGSLIFRTLLYEKASGVKNSGQVELRPFVREQLEAALVNSDFGKICCYGDYSRQTKWEPESEITVFEASY